MTPLSTTPWARTLVPPETLALLRRETPEGAHVSLYALSSRGPLRAAVMVVEEGRSIERLDATGSVEEVIGRVRAAIAGLRT